MKKSLVPSMLMISLLYAVGTMAGYGEIWSARIKRMLAEQGFTGTVDSKCVHLSRIGTMKCGPELMDVVFYEWDETAAESPGLARHASYRVLFLHDSKFLGAYVVEDKPLLHNNVLIFPYPPHMGNQLKCAADGPPAQAWLDGYNIPFSK